MHTSFVSGCLKRVLSNDFFGFNALCIVLTMSDKKEVQKIRRRVPRKTVNRTARCKGAVLFFWSSRFLARDPPVKLMSFVIFEKFRRIPEEKMSPLSGKYILGRGNWKKVIAVFFFFCKTWIGFSFQWKRTGRAAGWGPAPKLSRVCKVSGFSQEQEWGWKGNNIKWWEMLPLILCLQL